MDQAQYFQHEKHEKSGFFSVFNADVCMFRVEKRIYVTGRTWIRTMDLGLIRAAL